MRPLDYLWLNILTDVNIHCSRALKNTKSNRVIVQTHARTIRLLNLVSGDLEMSQ